MRPLAAAPTSTCPSPRVSARRNPCRERCSLRRLWRSTKIPDAPTGRVGPEIRKCATPKRPISTGQRVAAASAGHPGDHLAHHLRQLTAGLAQLAIAASPVRPSTFGRTSGGGTESIGISAVSLPLVRRYANPLTCTPLRMHERQPVRLVRVVTGRAGGQVPVAARRPVREARRPPLAPLGAWRETPCLGDPVLVTCPADAG
jgi:hypothetical protein